MREKKVEYLVLEVVFKLPPHLDINNTSLLKYQHTCLYAAYCIYIVTPRLGVGGYWTDLPSPALCLPSQILLGERSFDLLFLKRNLYNSCKAF